MIACPNAKRFIALFVIMCVCLLSASAGVPALAEQGTMAKPSAAVSSSPTQQPAVRSAEIKASQSPEKAPARATIAPILAETRGPTVAPTSMPTAAPTASPTPWPTDAVTAALDALLSQDASPSPEDPDATEAPVVELDAVILPDAVSISSLGNASGDVFMDTEHSISQFYEDYHFPGERSLQGIFSSIGMYVTMPEYCNVENATLLVSYTCSDLILTDISSLTFYMNNVPFYSCALEQVGMDKVVLYITVPLELMKDAYNLLEIRAYVRLSDDEGCIDDYAGANWVSIDEATCLRIGYSLIEDATRLDLYPYPYVSLLDPAGESLTVAMSDAAENSEMTAALMAMADLGKAVYQENLITLSRWKDVRSDNVIYFGLEKNTPNELLTKLDALPTQSTAAIQAIPHGEGQMLLCIAKEPDALIEAARLLWDDVRMEQLHTDSHSISVGEADMIMQDMVLSDLVVDGRYHLRDIVGSGISFTGPFRQESTVYLPVPKDYALHSDVKFELNMRYSDNLDFTRSLVTLYFGDIPLGSKKLTPEGVDGDTFVVSVPVDALGTHGTALTIAFDLEIKELICTPRQMVMPWAYVAGDSTLYLPPSSTKALNLALLPAPFQQNGRLRDVLVVMADDPGAQELVSVGRVVSMVGANADAYGDITAKRASEFDVERDANHHLIIVGQPMQNTMLQRMNESLLFRYLPDYSGFAKNNMLPTTDAYAKEIGTIQLLASPFAQDRAALVVTGPTQEAMQRLDTLVSRETMRWNLSYDTAVIDASGAISTYQSVRPQTEEAKKPSIMEIIAAQKDPLIFTLTATSMIAIMLVIIVMIALRAYRRNRK